MVKLREALPTPWLVISWPKRRGAYPALYRESLEGARRLCVYKGQLRARRGVECHATLEGAAYRNPTSPIPSRAWGIFLPRVRSMPAAHRRGSYTDPHLRGMRNAATRRTDEATPTARGDHQTCHTCSSGRTLRCASRAPGTTGSRHLARSRADADRRKFGTTATGTRKRRKRGVALISQTEGILGADFEGRSSRTCFQSFLSFLFPEAPRSSMPRGSYRGSGKVAGSTPPTPIGETRIKNNDMPTVLCTPMMRRDAYNLLRSSHVTACILRPTRRVGTRVHFVLRCSCVNN